MFSWRANHTTVWGNSRDVSKNANLLYLLIFLFYLPSTIFLLLWVQLRSINSIRRIYWGRKGGTLLGTVGRPVTSSGRYIHTYVNLKKTSSFLYVIWGQNRPDKEHIFIFIFMLAVTGASKEWFSYRVEVQTSLCRGIAHLGTMYEKRQKKIWCCLLYYVQPQVQRNKLIHTNCFQIEKIADSNRPCDSYGDNRESPWEYPRTVYLFQHGNLVSQQC